MATFDPFPFRKKEKKSEKTSASSTPRNRVNQPSFQLPKESELYGEAWGDPPDVTPQAFANQMQPSQREPQAPQRRKNAWGNLSDLDSNKQETPQKRQNPWGTLGEQKEVEQQKPLKNEMPSFEELHRQAQAKLMGAPLPKESANTMTDAERRKILSEPIDIDKIIAQTSKKPQSAPETPERPPAPPTNTLDFQEVARQRANAWGDLGGLDTAKKETPQPKTSFGTTNVMANDVQRPVNQPTNAWGSVRDFADDQRQNTPIQREETITSQFAQPVEPPSQREQTAWAMEDAQSLTQQRKRRASFGVLDESEEMEQTKPPTKKTASFGMLSDFEDEPPLSKKSKQKRKKRTLFGKKNDVEDRTLPFEQPIEDEILPERQSSLFGNRATNETRYNRQEPAYEPMQKPIEFPENTMQNSEFFGSDFDPKNEQNLNEAVEKSIERSIENRLNSVSDSAFFENDFDQKNNFQIIEGAGSLTEFVGQASLSPTAADMEAMRNQILGEPIDIEKIIASTQKSEPPVFSNEPLPQQNDVFFPNKNVEAVKEPPMQETTPVKETKIDDITAYVDRVCSFVRWKKARRLIRKELEDHIYEQRDHYIDEGDDSENATYEAILQMGDAEVVGLEYNATHSPKKQYAILGSLGFLFFFGLYIQNFLLQTQAEPQFKDLLQLGFACLAFAAFYILDFSLLGKYARWITPLLFVMPIGFLVVNAFEIYDFSATFHAYATFVFPLTYALLIYATQKTGHRGLIICLIGYLVLCAMLFFYEMYANLLLFSCTALALLHYAISRRWYGVNRKRTFAIVTALTTAFIVMAFIFIDSQPYLLDRIRIIFYPQIDPVDSGYLYVTVQDIIASCRFLGSGPFLETHLMHTLIDEFPLTYIAARTGTWVLFVAVIPMIVVIVVGAIDFRKQKTVIGGLLLIAVCLPLFFQCSIFILNATGRLILDSYFPMLSYGLVGHILSFAMIGMAASVCRIGYLCKDVKRQFAL